jgi:outer membrane receptor protein involved in Fe transport
LWLTDQEREDDDEAIFGELTFDITDTLSITGGVRFFESENSLKGFFGYGRDFRPEPAKLPARQARSHSAVHLARTSTRRRMRAANTKRFNMTWHATDNVMLYATWSEGFRPGGINRRGTLPPYKADFLTNMELGFKTELAGNRLRINGALFQEGLGRLPVFVPRRERPHRNPQRRQARIKGIETDILWQVTDGFSLSTAFSILDAQSTQDYCGTTYDQGPKKGESSPTATTRSRQSVPSCRRPRDRSCPCSPSSRRTPWVVTTSRWADSTRTCRLPGCTQVRRGADLRTDERELLGKQTCVRPRRSRLGREEG